jgi:hypothetical protein
MKTWLAGETAGAQTPRYVRDNIPVSLLAKAYTAFVGDNSAPGATRRLNPSGYAGTPVGLYPAPARRGCRPPRPPLPARFRDADRFPEAPVRINTDLLDVEALAWDEAQAWDEFVHSYLAAG